MKISWGYKIVFVYLAFVIGIVYLVFRASGESFDLVTKDYYEEELKYQQVIDASQRTASLSAPVVVKKESGMLSVLFPEDFKGRMLKGTFHLYFPADEKKDINTGFETVDLNYQKELPLNASGFYILKLRWTCDDIEYYYEKNIFI